MTQNFSATSTASFSETIRIYNSELIPMLVGLTVKSASAANNLDYKKADGTITQKCGLLVEFSDGTKVGLFRWDLLPSIVEYVDDKPRALVLNDALHKTAKDSLRTAQGEKAWLEAIAAAINGKTAAAREYFYKLSNGAVKNGVILTIG